MCELVKLPNVLLLEIYSTWLSMKYVAKLDSAMCCSERRASFLDLAQHLKTNCSAALSKGKLNQFLNWSNQRSVKLSSVDVSYLSIADARLLFARTGIHIEEILASLASCEDQKLLVPQLMQTVADTCPNLKKLDCSYVVFCDEQSMAAVLAGCPQLNILRLVSCDFRSYDTIKNINAHAINLQNLAFHHNRFASTELSEQFVVNKTLREVKLSDLKKFSQFVPWITQCRALVKLSLNGASVDEVCSILQCCVTVKELVAFVPVENAENLDTYTIPHTVIASLIDLAQNLSVLKIMPLQFQTIVDDASLCNLISSCPKLQFLATAVLSSYKETPLPAPVASLDSFTSSIAILHVSSICPEKLLGILKLCPKLIDLRATQCLHWTKDDIRRVCTYLQNVPLQALVLSDIQMYRDFLPLLRHIRYYLVGDYYYYASGL